MNQSKQPNLVRCFKVNIALGVVRFSAFNSRLASRWYWIGWIAQYSARNDARVGERDSGAQCNAQRQRDERQQRAVQPVSNCVWRQKARIQTKRQPEHDLRRHNASSVWSTDAAAATIAS